jgi:hypothetical protein
MREPERDIAEHEPLAEALCDRLYGKDAHVVMIAARGRMCAPGTRRVEADARRSVEERRAAIGARSDQSAADSICSGVIASA